MIMRFFMIFNCEHVYFANLLSGYVYIVSNMFGTVPPRWAYPPSEQVSVVANGDVTMHCQATGYPVPSSKWIKIVGEFFLMSFFLSELHVYSLLLPV